jgi:cyclic-di-GMP-binding protein
MSIELSVPVQRAAPGKDLEVRPRQVKAWIESQPLHLSFEAGRRLCAHLAEVNRAQLAPEAHLQIVELHRSAAQTLVEALEASYRKAPLPLGPGPRAALGLVRELTRELALGYRIAANEHSRKLLGSKRQLALLLARVMRYTAARLLAGYRSYTPAPSGTWRDLYEIYLAAEAHGLARDAADAATGESVEDILIEALLLSLTDPYRLGPGEVDRVLQQVRTNRGLATLGRSRPPRSPKGQFMVPCNSDQPPKPSLSASDDTGGPDWRLLDANPVVAKLRSERDALLGGKGPAGVAKSMGSSAPELLARLIALWGDPPKRASRRDPAQATVAICLGFKAVGHFVSLAPRLDLESEDERLRRGITMPLMALPLGDDGQPIPIFEWEVVNQSRGGLKVRRNVPTQQPIAVGEVAGIKFPARAHWAIGVVRWITLFEEGGMEFGLQYLAPAARMVWVRTWGDPARIGLLTSEEPAGVASLLTPPNTFAQRRELELDEDGQTCLVRATELLESSPRFELFNVTRS